LLRACTGFPFYRYQTGRGPTAIVYPVHPLRSRAEGLNNHVSSMTKMTEIRQFFQRQRNIISTSPGNFHHGQKNDSSEIPTASGFKPIKG